MNKLPKHVAIVMDGNGRWAQQRNLPRVAGHEAGAKAVRKIIEVCAKKQIQVLSLFAFSSENWQRPEMEVGFLMKLFFRTLQRETKRLHKNNIQLRIIGDYSRFDSKLRERIIESQALTAKNTGLILVIAANYSGRWDILQATQKVFQNMIEQAIPSTQINYEHIQQALCISDLPEPDLFIRTSGELRISNFMLWQLAYTELYFTNTLWPDFDEEEFETALTSFNQRERRFGLVANNK